MAPEKKCLLHYPRCSEEGVYAQAKQSLHPTLRHQRRAGRRCAGWHRRSAPCAAPSAPMFWSTTEPTETPPQCSRTGGPVPSVMNLKTSVSHLRFHRILIWLSTAPTAQRSARSSPAPQGDSGRFQRPFNPSRLLGSTLHSLGLTSLTTCPRRISQVLFALERKNQSAVTTGNHPVGLSSAPRL